MSTNIVPFDLDSKVPAHIRARAGRVDNSALGQVRSAGFANVSIKGKQFAVVRDGERKLIEDPRTGDPAAAIQVAVIRANPNYSRTYYSGGFQEGADGRPECFSNDEIKPHPNAISPQAKSCAVCPHFPYGTGAGGKGSACKRVKRLAIATVDNLDAPMLLRVPTTSINNLSLYGEFLTKKDVTVNDVVTRIGFDPAATHQVLTFKAMDYLDEATIEKIDSLQTDSTVLQITGEKPYTPAPVAEAPKPAPALRAVPAIESEEEEETPAPTAAKPKVRVRQDIEDEAPPAPVAQKAAAKAPAPINDLDEDIGSFLDAAFDDD